MILQCVRNSILRSKHRVLIKSAGTIWEAQLHVHLVGVLNLLQGSIHLLYKRDYVLTTFFALLRRSSNDDLSWRLFGLAQFVHCGRFFLELNFIGLYPGSKRERKIRRRMFTSSIKRSIRRFDVVVGQWTSKKCTKKRGELLFCS